jgi:hypothetical protein
VVIQQQRFISSEFDLQLRLSEADYTKARTDQPVFADLIMPAQE